MGFSSENKSSGGSGKTLNFYTLFFIYSFTKVPPLPFSLHLPVPSLSCLLHQPTSTTPPPASISPVLYRPHFLLFKSVRRPTNPPCLQGHTGRQKQHEHQQHEQHEALFALLSGQHKHSQHKYRSTWTKDSISIGPQKPIRSARVRVSISPGQH